MGDDIKVYLSEREARALLHAAEIAEMAFKSALSDYGSGCALSIAAGKMASALERQQVEAH